MGSDLAGPGFLLALRCVFIFFYLAGEETGSKTWEYSWLSKSLASVWTNWRCLENWLLGEYSLLLALGVIIWRGSGELKLSSA